MNQVPLGSVRTIGIPGRTPRSLSVAVTRSSGWLQLMPSCENTLDIFWSCATPISV
jgi:hypothetical protein